MSMAKLLTDIMVQEPAGSGGTYCARSPKGHRASKTAADSPASRDSGSLDSSAQLRLSCEAEDPSPAGEAAQLEEHADHTQEEQETQPQHDEPDSVQQCPVDLEQNDNVSQSQQEPQADATGCEAGKQQSATQGLTGVNSLPAQRKEPLCLRVRPLDSSTRRLMQSLGCTALLEMPNNK